MQLPSFRLSRKGMRTSVIPYNYHSLDRIVRRGKMESTNQWSGWPWTVQVFVQGELTLPDKRPKLTRRGKGSVDDGDLQETDDS